MPPFGKKKKDTPHASQGESMVPCRPVTDSLEGVFFSGLVGLVCSPFCSQREHHAPSKEQLVRSHVKTVSVG